MQPTLVDAYVYVPEVALGACRRAALEAAVAAVAMAGRSKKSSSRRPHTQGALLLMSLSLGWVVVDLVG